MDSDHTQFGRNLYFQKKKKWVKVLNSESGSEPLEESLEMKGSCDSASYTSTLKKKVWPLNWGIKQTQTEQNLTKCERTPDMSQAHYTFHLHKFIRSIFHSFIKVKTSSGSEDFGNLLTGSHTHSETETQIKFLHFF